MDEMRNAKVPRLFCFIAVVISVIALASSILLTITNNNTANHQLSYDAISPHVEDYLLKNNIMNEEGLIPIPSISGEEPDTVTIEEAINQLIVSGKFDYLKGEKGDTGSIGATGETGAQGTQGEQGIPGTAVEKGDKGDKGDQGNQGDPGDPGVMNVGTGMTLSGGTLSLKPCAVGQVLSVGSSLQWDCATVSADGVATSNVSAQLTLAGTSLQASITDSDDNTVNASPINLGNTFATDAELSNALTTAITNLNMAQYIDEQELADEIDELDFGQYITDTDLSTAMNSATGNLISQAELTSAISSLNLGQFATTANLSALTTRVGALETASSDHTSRIATLETNAVNYVTDSGLASSLGNYYQKTQTYSAAQTNNLLIDKQDKLPLCTDGQVVKFNFATTTWVCGNDEDTHVNLSTYASQTWVSGRIAANNDNYTTTTDLSALLASKANTTALTTVSTNLANNYTSTAALQLLLDDKQDEFPNCSDGQVLKYDNNASVWTCGSDLVGSVNLSGYATESWVLAQNYASTSAVSSLSGMLSGVDLRVVTLENAGYVTTSSLNSHLKTADLSTELLTRINAGVGVNITNNNGVFTINALAQTDVYEIVNDHTATATPSSNKIYIDVATTPVTQWVYEGMSWTKIGEVSFDTSNYYTKAQTENAISNAVSANSANYTTTADLATLLGGKVDQSTFNSLSSRVFAVEGAGYITTASLNGYLETSSLASELSSRLVAGNGINIVNNNGVFTFTATGGGGSGGGSGGVYEIVNDHTTVTFPDINKIYIDFSTDPAEQWIYDGTSWQIIGQISFDLDNYYTKTQADAMVGGAIVASNANYTTSANLTALLAAKANQSSLSVTDNRVTALEGAGYITSSALNGYLKTADLSVELSSRLAAGEGIQISNNGGVFTIDSIAETDVYEVVNDHTLVIGPHNNKIYIDIAADPAEQWVYEGGVWRLVGQVNFDIADYYTSTQTDTAIADAISTTSADYTTTSALNVLLAAKANSADLVATNTNLANNYTTTNATAALLGNKQDKLPTCADNQVIKYNSDASQWICADDMNTQVNLSGYATQTWASGQITAQLASYTTTTDLDTLLEDKADASALTALSTNLTNNYTTTNALTNLLADKQDNLPVCLDGQVLKYDISLGTDNWVCAADDDTHVDLSSYTTESWVTGEIAANNDSYTTTTDLNTLLATKADQTALTAVSTELSTEVSNRIAADTSLSGRITTIEGDYLTSTALTNLVTVAQINDMATESWVNAQGFLKTDALSTYATESWVTGRGYITNTTLGTSLANYYNKTEVDAATSGAITTYSTTAEDTFIMKSAINCSSSQALIGAGANGQINCRAIADITTGSLAASTGLVTANTLKTVLNDYYTKAEIDTMNIVTGASQSYQIEVVTTLPASPDPNTLYVILGN